MRRRAAVSPAATLSLAAAVAHNPCPAVVSLLIRRAGEGTASTGPDCLTPELWESWC